jgi:hypothetical protein
MEGWKMAIMDVNSDEYKRAVRQGVRARDDLEKKIRDISGPGYSAFEKTFKVVQKSAERSYDELVAFEEKYYWYRMASRVFPSQVCLRFMYQASRPVLEQDREHFGKWLTIGYWLADRDPKLGVLVGEKVISPAIYPPFEPLPEEQAEARKSHEEMDEAWWSACEDFVEPMEKVYAQLWEIEQHVRQLGKDFLTVHPVMKSGGYHLGYIPTFRGSLLGCMNFLQSRPEGRAVIKKSGCDLAIWRNPDNIASMREKSA